MPVYVRPVYPLLLALCFLLFLTGCAATGAILPPEVPAMHSVSEVKDEYIAQSPDPWVGFNRRMYRFNYNLDKYFLLPVVTGYEFITPVIVQKGISQVFSNIREVRNLTNSVCQLKGIQSMKTLGRFVINSTVGIGGIFDPATSMGMEKQDEDFGQTLGYWGVKSGPYLVLPFYGPSNVRDTGGIVVDAGVRMAIISAIDPFGNVDHGNAIKTGISVLDAVDKRHAEKFRYYGSAYPFEYEMIRFLSGKQRELQIMK
jgi:phospholipid-binding lipoprotein MlaA